MLTVAAALGIAVALSTAPALAAPPSGEQPLTGRFVLLHADSSRTALTIPAITVGKTIYRLHGRPAYPFTPGQPVRATGHVVGRDVTVSAIEATGSAPTTPTSLNVLVELVYWTAPDSVTPAQAQQQYDVTNNTWFSNASYGQMTEHGAATRWLQIPAPADPDGSGSYTPCDNIGAIEDTGDQAATAAGYDLSPFSNIVYYYPTCADEQWGGWGMVGGNRTWLIGEMDTRVAVHELGHNLGLMHSHSETCSLNGATVPYSTTCTSSEYGDPISAMGAGFWGQGMFAANQQAYLGWLGSGGHAVTTVISSGTYSLSPLESMSGGTQALKVVNGNGIEFWIEYRQPVRNDSYLWPGATDGVLIRAAGGTASDLYDMTVGTPGNFTDAALPVGSTWSDPTSKLSVTVTAATPSAARVSVSGASGCPDSALEPDNSPAQARSQAIGATSRHGFCTPNDQDWIKFRAAAGGIYDLRTLNLTPGTDTVLELYGTDAMTLIARNDDSNGTLASQIEFTPAATGTYYLMAQQFGGTANAAYAYDLQVTRTGTRYQETAAQFDGWFVWNDATANGGSWRTSQLKNDTAAFTFTGTGVTWLSNKGPSRGIAAVTLDGVSKGTVDLYRATSAPFAKAFTGLHSGKHTLVLRVTGNKNAASTGRGVVVDGFTVGSTTTQESANAIKYDTWKGGASANASGGAYRSSGTAGARAQLTFTGTSVDWVTTTGPGWGRARVSIDGVDKGIADLYASAAHWQTLETYGGLPAGVHTIVIQALGTKNAAASSTNVAVDGFVTH